MKKKSVNKFISKLVLTFLIILCISAEASGQELYGVTLAGKLVTINTSTGAATEAGDLGINLSNDGYPQGMAYNPRTGLLYVTTYVSGGLGRMFSVDPGTAQSTSFGSWSIGSYAMTYRYVDDLLYRLDQSTASTIISRWDASGTWIDDLGFLQDVTAIQGLAVRPSDGMLFGAGYNSRNEDALFIIPTTGDPYSLVSVTQVGPTGTNILALTFWPNGVLLGSDGSNLLRVDAATGNVQVVGSFGMNPVVGLAVAADHTAGPVDVWMKDCLADIGNDTSVPTPCQVAYMSPDIWIDNNQDMILDEPVVEEINKLKARVRNRESGVAEEVSVKFYYRNNSTGLHFPEGANYIGEDIVTIPPNSQALASVEWNVPAPPTTGGHWCIGVVLDHPNDSIPSPAPAAKDHNNIAIANIWHLTARAGEEEYMSFVMGTGGRGGWGLTPWPRDFVLEVDANLPTGWNWELEGAPVGQPITLKLGEEREVKLKIHAAENAAPHSGGSVEVRQMDVATQQVVGGLIYNLYEDHIPPEPVRELRANLVDGYALLNWEEVRKEAETGMRERVSYYQILRDGEVVAKAVIDQDADKPGYQWKDPERLQGTVVYSIRAVDQGGNISQVSPEVKLIMQGKLFNWLTWLLLILVVILLVLFINRKGTTG